MGPQGCIQNLHDRTVTAFHSCQWFNGDLMGIYGDLMGFMVV